MERLLQESARSVRAALEQGSCSIDDFRGALAAVPLMAQDVWLDRVLGIGEVPEDSSQLPRGCVPYLPCSVDAIVRATTLAGMDESDVFVDVGCGVGRALLLVQLLCGGTGVGIEIQQVLASRARMHAAELHLRRVTIVEGDAPEVVRELQHATVFFLYCPFGAERLARFTDALEPLARIRELRICAVDVRLPARPWLSIQAESRELLVYRTG